MLKLIIKLCYTLKLDSFSCKTSLSLFTSFLINLLFSYIYITSIRLKFVTLSRIYNNDTYLKIVIEIILFEFVRYNTFYLYT